MQFKVAKVFIDESGPVRSEDKYVMVVCSVITNDKLNWIPDNYHYRDDKPERREEFLKVLSDNSSKFKVILVKYLIYENSVVNHLFKMYVEDPLVEISQFVKERVDVFYDSFRDKLSIKLRRELDSMTKRMLREKGIRLVVKEHLSVGESGLLAEVHRRGISISDYIASLEMRAFLGKTQDGLEQIRRAYVVKKIVELP